MDEIMKRRSSKKQKGPKSPKKQPKEDKPQSPSKKPTFSGVKNKITEKDLEAIDYTNKVQRSELEKEKAMQDKIEAAKREYLINSDEDEETKEMFYDSDEELSFGSESEEEKSSGGLFSKFTSRIKTFTGNKEMTEEELKPVLSDFADGLIAKNVAAEIAHKLCDSVMQSLLQ